MRPVSGGRPGRQGEDPTGFPFPLPPREDAVMNPESAPARRTLPRLAAAATVTAALVAGGAAAVGPHPSPTTDVQAIINAWPKKYTGVSLVVDPPSDTVTD